MKNTTEDTIKTIVYTILTVLLFFGVTYFTVIKVLQVETTTSTSENVNVESLQELEEHCREVLGGEFVVINEADVECNVETRE